MQPPKTTVSSDISALVERLVRMSREDPFDPFKQLIWPDHLEPGGFWMTPDLLSPKCTPQMATLTAEQTVALSKYETRNFYSLNIHGIRDLLVEVGSRIHTPGFEEISEFLHVFIAEENEHMWYFARFCVKYCGGLYPERKVKFSGPADPAVAAFLVFARILIFEEIVDFFNTRIAEDEALHPFIRQINGLHHIDESRHIAFGRGIVKSLYQQLGEDRDTEKMHILRKYIESYIVACVRSLYNPQVYRDVGIAEPHAFRKQLLRSPLRRLYHERMLKRTIDFLVKSDILQTEEGVLSNVGE